MLKFKLPFYVKILIGMAIGVVLGLVAVHFNASSFVTNWVKPFGEIFIRLLKLIAIPLVLVSLIKGIGGLKDISKLATMGVRTLLIYIGTTIVAIIIGVSLVVLLCPGEMVSLETSESLAQSCATSVSKNVEAYQTAGEQSPLQPLVDVFPSNAILAMSDNTAMLQIIFMAILIGIAVVIVGTDKSSAFMNLIESVDAIVLKIIDIVMKMSPFGVMALLSTMVVDTAGDLSLLAALAMYGVTVVLGLLIIMYLFYPLIVEVFTDIKALDFIKALIPVQLVGFSTSSSAATLPTTMNVTNEVLKLPKRVTSFVLPVGVTINMDGTSCYQAISVIFIAQAMGIDLSFLQILTVIATTTISSIGTPGIPGGSVVMTMMVLSSIGIPPEGLALILGMDRPLDMIRTSVNVTGDAAVASIVSKQEGKLGN